ncbi:hypothetical protein BSL78_16769 [Apostichopus japonicus]|uniref:Stabilizer of axonemal microtubules 2 n=1 Tax=Stichopus japonicus TaxID=307972 RepID=A0A2G8KEF2_STIJA|nr:hypothetical protein BSL78_16769 [Apostichopus japonicus]
MSEPRYYYLYDVALDVHRHRCPHRPKAPRAIGPCTITEYTAKYPAHPTNGLRKSFKPNEDIVRGTGPLSDQTTNRRDFIPHEVNKIAVREPDQYKKMPGNMDLLTSYVRDYPEKRAPPIRAVKGHDQHRPAGEFKGVPTYTDDYRKWSLPMRDTGPVQHAYVPPSAPFNGTSTFNRDYQPKRVPMRESMRPAENTHLSSAPLEDMTSHRVDYIPHSAQPRYVHQQMPYQKNMAPFQGLTTFQKDYTGKRTSPPQPRAQQAWVQPQGNMDLATTARLAFPAHRVQPVKPSGPVRRVKSAEAPFDDRTNYKQDFRQWDSRPERRGDPTQKLYERSNIPFEGNTDYRTQYVPKHAQVPQSFAPDNSPNLSSDPFDDRTMYKLDYIPKEAPQCPAISLPNNGYRFQRVDSRGHEFWMKNNSNGMMERTMVTPPEQINLAFA